MNKIFWNESFTKDSRLGRAEPPMATFSRFETFEFFVCLESFCTDFEGNVDFDNDEFGMETDRIDLVGSGVKTYKECIGHREIGECEVG